MSERYKKKEYPTAKDELDRCVGTGDYKPINEFDALMRTIPLHDPDDVDGISPLRQAIIDSVAELSEKDQFVINAIYSERITYEELGGRLGYKPQAKGSPQAYIATQRALAALKEIIVQNEEVIDFLMGIKYYD